ncbi:MAG: TraB/GumN family protein [Steroidobacteraceae bacterium]|nr:TraB/GumN family protein [Steroidobacteraceae bacterium]
MSPPMPAPRIGPALRAAAKLGLLALALALPAAGMARDRSILWTVEGHHNTVYLLGSVHVLRPGDAALPDAAERAFDDAEQLVMEIDVDDPGSDPLSMAMQMQQAAMLPAGQTLKGVLGSDYTSINERAQESGIDLEALDAFAPWFVAIALLDLELAKRGFSPEFGIEQTLAARAIEQHKPIEGLETAAQQFQMLASMPLAQQKRFLVMTLDESAQLDRELEALLRAWRTGDTEALAALLAGEYEDFPDLYRRLTVERNRAWVGRLADLLDDRDDYLVVVGALHLVGPDSVVDLLRQRGYTVTQQ